jgi:hypothetical protein
MHGTDDETRRSATSAEKDLTITKAPVASDEASATQTADAKTKTANKKKNKSTARARQIEPPRISKKFQKSPTVQPADMVTDKSDRASPKLVAEDNHSRPLRQTGEVPVDKNDDESPAMPPTGQTTDPEIRPSTQARRSTSSISPTEATARDPELLPGTSSTPRDPAAKKKIPTAATSPEFEEDADDEYSDSQEYDDDNEDPPNTYVIGRQKPPPPRGVGTHVVFRYPSGTTDDIPEEWLNSKECMEREKLLEARAHKEAEARGEEYKPPVEKEEWDPRKRFRTVNNTADLESNKDE